MAVPGQRRSVIDALFENLHDVYFETTPEGILLHVSPGVRRLLGFEPREVEGRPVVDRYADPAQREQILERLRQDGFVDDANVDMLDRDGRVVSCSLGAVLMPGHAGEDDVIRGLLRDISDRRKFERELRESEERFRVVFETTPDPVGITRVEDGTFVDVNEAMLEASGYRREELIGRSTLSLGIWADVDQRRLLLDSLAREGVVRDLETRFRVKDGRVITALVSARLVSIGGKPHILAVSRDVESIRRLEREHQRLVERMRKAQKLESLGLLAGGIAHDFNNLLVSVLGNAELISHRMSADDPLREPISQIADAASRASELCRELLAYAGRGHLEFAPCDLNAIVQETSPLLRFFPSKKVTISVETADRPLPVRADATQIRQLILNLATNAAEAIGDAEGTIRIGTGRTRCTKEFLRTTFVDDRLEQGDYAVLSVTDDGCGMTPETCERVFDPFFSTKVSGRGLGLATVLGIVRGHHGAIRIDSSVGRGTTVEVFLPLTDEPIELRTEAMDRDDGTWAGEGTILLVDDDLAVRSVARRMIERLGFEVLEAADGVEALDLFRSRRERIRAVILDLLMPKMTGEEVLSAMVDIDPGVRVILSSGYSPQQSDERARGDRPPVYLQKPYTLAALKDALRSLLAGD